MTPVPRVGIDARGRLAVVDAFPWREAIKDLPGSRWLPGQKAWTLPATAGSAAALLTVLVESGAQVSPRVLALAREASTREERRAVAADESAVVPELPWHEWLRTSPRQYQKRGMIFLDDSSAALLGMGMGTGKSLTVVGAMNKRGIKKALIVCPAATLGVFPRELRQHSAEGIEWHTENGTRRTRNKTIKKLSLVERWNLIQDLYRCGCGKPHAAVIGYEALVRDPVASADLAALGIELIVYDECHRLKSAGGAMSLTAASWVNQVPLRWGLSGTPMPQSPDDIYGTYRALDPAIFGTNKTEFRAKYIVMGQTKDGREFPKDVYYGQRLEFSRRFHSIAFVPVVDLKLPKATHTIRSFELEPAARKIYNDIRDHGVAEISAAVVAAGGDPTPDGDERTVAPANAGVELLRFAQITGGAVRDDDENVSVVSTAKVEALGEVLTEVGCRIGGYDGRSRPEPVVVFCRFRSDLDAVQQLCRDRGLRYAEVSGRRKDGIDDDAKMNPNCDVVAAQIASGSQGIDFTRARVNAWYSVGFELWLFQQALKRSDRIGQTRSVMHFYLVAEETIDGAIYTALARREDVISSCTNAYLRHVAERPSSELPLMMSDGGEVAGDPVTLPEWMNQAGPPRSVPNRQLEEEHAVLALGGLEGF